MCFGTPAGGNLRAWQQQPAALDVNRTTITPVCSVPEEHRSCVGDGCQRWQYHVSHMRSQVSHRSACTTCKQRTSQFHKLQVPLNLQPIELHYYKDEFQSCSVLAIQHVDRLRNLSDATRTRERDLILLTTITTQQRSPQTRRPLHP